MLTFPGWHACPAHAVLDDGEQRTVAEPLNGRIREIRHLRVHVLTHLGAPVPISSMTYGTVILVMIGCRSPSGRVFVKGIVAVLRLGRDREAEESCRNRPLECAWL